MGRRSETPLAALGAVALCATLAASCTLEDFRAVGRGAPRDRAMPTRPYPAPVAAVPTRTDPTAMEGTPAGYPPPTTTPAPTWTPEPTPDYGAALPAGAALGPGAPTYIWHGRAPDGRLEAVPYTLGRRPGLAIVDTGATPPDRLWSLADAGIEPPIGASLTAAWVTSDLPGALPAAVAIVDEATELILLVDEEGGIRARARLLVPDPSLAEARPEVIHVGLGGDDGRERLVLAHDPPRAWVYPAAGDETAPSADGRALDPIRPLAALDGAVQLHHLDRDGTSELVVAREPGRWQVYAWRDGRVVLAREMTDTAAPTPMPANEGALAGLTGRLYFWREGKVQRLGRNGIETVYAAPVDGAWSAPSGHEFPYGPLLQVSRDGRVVVVVEKGCVRPKCDSADLRFAVRNLETDRDNFIPFRLARPESGGGRWRSWDVSADGRWLVFAEADDAERSVDGTGLRIMAVDLTAEPPARHRLARCGALDAGPEHSVIECRPTVAIAPDGRAVAYDDPVALRVVRVPDGHETRSVPHTYGRTEAAVVRSWPREWSPDGRRLLLGVGYYENADTAVLDVATGHQAHVPDSMDWGVAVSEMAWREDGDALVHTRVNGGRGSALLRLVSIGTADGGASAEDDAEAMVLSERALLPIDPIDHGADPAAIAPLAGDGTIRFVLRAASGRAYWGNGLFRIGADGRDWSRLVALPPAIIDESDLGVRDWGLWSLDGDHLLLLPGTARWQPSPSKAILLIAADGSTVTDVGALLAGGRDYRWTH